MTEGTYVPEHRLQSLRLSTFTTFVYFGLRYLFFGSEKLHPIQFLGVSLEPITFPQALQFHDGI